MPKPLRHEVYLFEDIFLLFRGFLIKEFPKYNFLL